MAMPPAPPPEARLLRLHRKARRMSVARAADLAGVSISLWRQVEAGYFTPAAGVHMPKVAPADTLAVMSKPLGIVPAQLTEAGRDDAAQILAELTPAPAAAAPAAGTLSDDEDTSARVVIAISPIEREVMFQVTHGPPFTDFLERTIMDMTEESLEKRVREVAALRWFRSRPTRTGVRRAG
jgi:transcriptional regulator with XRE-family HTH domain